MTDVMIPLVDRAVAVPLITARGLSKTFGSTRAVIDLDLDVAPGEVVGFLGPNGAGKTTVLRILTGALRATSGRVSVLGADPFRAAAQVHEQIGYLPGDLRLPGHLTGGEILDLFASLRTGGSRHRTRLVQELGLDITVPVHALSKGNRQKIGIVQALMAQPKLLLLDEPTSGLDPLAQRTFEQLVRQAADQGAAVLLSSHVLREVEQVADRVVMLRAGRLAASTRLDVLRANAPHEVKVDLDDPSGLRRLSAVAGVREMRIDDSRAAFLVPTGSLGALLSALATEKVRDVSIAPADLETVFTHLYEGEGHGSAAAATAS